MGQHGVSAAKTGPFAREFHEEHATYNPLDLGSNPSGPTRESLQVGADDFNDVLDGILGLRILRHMIADVIFEELTHQAID